MESAPTPGWKAMANSLCSGESEEMASVMGVNSRKVNARAFAFGAALAAIAGVLLAPMTAVTAYMGINYLARSFFVVLVGGAGGVSGVAAGSVIIGGTETTLSYQLPTTVAQALVLVLAIVILRFRPRGIMPT